MPSASKFESASSSANTTIITEILGILSVGITTPICSNSLIVRLVSASLIFTKILLVVCKLCILLVTSNVLGVSAMIDSLMASANAWLIFTLPLLSLIPNILNSSGVSPIVAPASNAFNLLKASTTP